MSADILHLSQLAARLEAHLASSTLAVLTPGAAELLIEALVHLLPVLRALDAMIASATRRETA